MIDYILIILLIVIMISSFVDSYLCEKREREYHEMLMREYLKEKRNNEKKI